MLLQAAWRQNVAASRLPLLENLPKPRRPGRPRHKWKRLFCRRTLGGGNSNIVYFHSYLWKWSNLTNMFQTGWNHQLGHLNDSNPCFFFLFFQFLERSVAKVNWNTLSGFWQGQQTATPERQERTTRNPVKPVVAFHAPFPVSKQSNGAVGSLDIWGDPLHIQMFVIQFVAKRHPFEADVTPSPEMPKYDSQHFSQLDGMPLSFSIQGADESRKLLLQNQLRSSWALEKAMVLWRSSLLARRTMNRFYEMRCAALLETAGKPRMKTWTSREYPRSHFSIVFQKVLTSLFTQKTRSLEAGGEDISRPKCPNLSGDAAIPANPHGAQGDRTMVPLEWSFSSRLQGRDLDALWMFRMYWKIW